MEMLCLFCDAAPRSPALSEAAQLQNFQEQRGRKSPGCESVSWDRPEEAPLLRAPAQGTWACPAPACSGLELCWAQLLSCLDLGFSPGSPGTLASGQICSIMTTAGVACPTLRTSVCVSAFSPASDPAVGAMIAQPVLQMRNGAWIGCRRDFVTLVIHSSIKFKH